MRCKALIYPVCFSMIMISCKREKTYSDDLNSLEQFFELYVGARNTNQLYFENDSILLKRGRANSFLEQLDTLVKFSSEDTELGIRVRLHQYLQMDSSLLIENYDFQISKYGYGLKFPIDDYLDSLIRADYEELLFN